MLLEGDKIDERFLRLHIELNDENAGWLLAAPGMSVLAAVSNDMRRLAATQSVASPFTEHREFANQRLRNWKPYENMERGVIPGDALMAGSVLGIQFYYLPDLKVIDRFGLTDKTVARNPVTKPNHWRVIAHDRHPPPDYLEQRGVNFTVYPAASSADQALERGMYAVWVGPSLWMPFDSDDQHWVAASFVGHDLRVRKTFSTNTVDSSFHYIEQGYVVEQFVESFEDGFDGWLVEGKAVTNHARHIVYGGQSRISGNVGTGFLTSYHPSEGNKATGRALSPEFIAQDNQVLAFRIAGGAGEGVGVRLLADSEEAAVWRGQDSEHFRLVVHELTDHAGKLLQLELFDNELGGWGHIMLDHVILTQREAPEHIPPIAGQ